jgi:hypothetical protein
METTQKEHARNARRATVVAIATTLWGLEQGACSIISPKGGRPSIGETLGHLLIPVLGTVGALIYRQGQKEKAQSK